MRFRTFAQMLCSLRAGIVHWVCLALCIHTAAIRPHLDVMTTDSDFFLTMLVISFATQIPAGSLFSSMGFHMTVSFSLWPLYWLSVPLVVQNARVLSCIPWLLLLELVCRYTSFQVIHSPPGFVGLWNKIQTCIFPIFTINVIIFSMIIASFLSVITFGNSRWLMWYFH